LGPIPMTSGPYQPTGEKRFLKVGTSGTVSPQYEVSREEASLDATPRKSCQKGLEHDNPLSESDALWICSVREPLSVPTALGEIPSGVVSASLSEGPTSGKLE